MWWVQEVALDRWIRREERREKRTGEEKKKINCVFGLPLVTELELSKLIFGSIFLVIFWLLNIVSACHTLRHTCTTRSKNQEKKKIKKKENVIH